MFTGSNVALVTPFINNQIDHRAIRSLVKWHARSGTQSIIVCGTTGESLFLTEEEQRSVVATAVEASDGAIPIVVGCGVASTAQSIKLAKNAENEGADALMLVAPYYVKPTQDQILHHIKMIHEATQLPLMLYNNPARTVVDMSVETILHAAKEFPRVVALKDASPDLTRATQLRMTLPREFTLLSGDDGTLPAFLAQGGDGIVSVMANIIPEMVSQFVHMWHARSFDAFDPWRNSMLKLSKALSVAPSPAPIKYALSVLDKCNAGVRPPLTELSEKDKNKVYDTMFEIGVLQRDHV